MPGLQEAAAERLDQILDPGGSAQVRDIGSQTSLPPVP